MSVIFTLVNFRIEKTKKKYPKPQSIFNAIFLKKKTFKKAELVIETYLKYASSGFCRCTVFLTHLHFSVIEKSGFFEEDIVTMFFVFCEKNYTRYGKSTLFLLTI